MGAPSTGMQTSDQASAEALLGAFRTIKAAERRKHASVLNYWLSIRGDKEFPPLHDLDPLELSDAGPHSALLELLSGGHDAEIRHVGEAVRAGNDWPERIMDAPAASILGCIGKKLPIVAISRDFLAFEDAFSTDAGVTRCWVTLLPLSAGGAWVDYVYAFVTFDAERAEDTRAAPNAASEPAEEAVEIVEPAPDQIDETSESALDLADAPAMGEEVDQIDADEAPADDPAEEANEPSHGSAEPQAKPRPAPGFSKLFDSLAGLTGFHAQSVKVDPVLPEPTAEEAAADEFETPVADDEVDEPVAKEQADTPVDQAPVEDAPADDPAVDESESDAAATVAPVEPPEPAGQVKQNKRTAEGTLQDKLTDVRAKADEARMAKLRANAALYEGLSAAYDFALEAEDSPEEYLRLVEAQGLKIQLRSPMKPVVKLAFDGLCDEATIKQLEAVLAWAFDQELPRGALADRIQQAGGIGGVLAKAA